MMTKEEVSKYALEMLEREVQSMGIIIIKQDGFIKIRPPECADPTVLEAWERNREREEY